jgi:hypothetical protein
MAMFNGYVNLPEGTGKKPSSFYPKKNWLTPVVFPFIPQDLGDFPICSA